MTMSGITGAAVSQAAERILIPMGEYFQVQDDYLDCFGAPEVIGKIGTDIVDYKCSWLIITAVALASPEQKAILVANYGKPDPESEARVKALYQELELQRHFEDYERESYCKLNKLIEECDEAMLPKAIFIRMVDKIYRRVK